MKIQLSKYLINLDHKLSICCDIWTDSYFKNHYMGITCHFIDNSWTLNKRLITFREFAQPHNAINIAQLIVIVLNEFQLINKVFSVGFDNASSNTASIPDLIAACSPSFNGKYFHSRCICHILNLCVQDALTIFNENVEPIRQAIKLLHNNTRICKKWQRYCRNKEIPFTRFIRDVSTRWNSTYRMLNSTINHREYLCDFFRTCPDSGLLVLPNCWDSSMDLYRLLKTFHTATVDLSGVYYCTSVRVPLHCLYIAAHFHSCMLMPNPPLQTMVYFMIVKWLKYFREIPTVFLIAKVLDPKWKLNGVFGIIDNYYQCFQNLPIHNIQLVSGEFIDLDIPNVQQIKDNLERNLRDLFNEYEIAYNRTHQRRPPPQTRNYTPQFNFEVNPSNPTTQNILNLLSNTGRRGVRTNRKLDMYLDLPSIFEETGPDDQVDVLNWWANHEKDYPILASMAKEIFAVPASTVSVEQAFSIGGLMLDEKRSSMNASNMEATMLLDDWSRAELRAQEAEWEDQNDSEHEQVTDSERSDAAADDDN